MPSARAPDLRDTLERAIGEGLPHVVLDGTLVRAGLPPTAYASGIRAQGRVGIQGAYNACRRVRTYSPRRAEGARAPVFWRPR